MSKGIERLIEAVKKDFKAIGKDFNYAYSCCIGRFAGNDEADKHHKHRRKIKKRLTKAGLKP